MVHSSPRTQTRTILYVAPAADVARDGAETVADAAADADSNPDFEPTVRPLESIDRLRESAPNADCVVFCESASDDVTMSLLEVATACDTTPLVVFTDTPYASAVARSAEEIDGYVRRGTDDAVVHLVDEISRVCHRVPAHEADTTEGKQGTTDPNDQDGQERTRAPTDPAPEPRAERERARARPTDDRPQTTNDRSRPTEDRSQHTGNQPRPTNDQSQSIERERPPSRADPRTATALLETTSRIVDCRDRELLFGRVVEGAVGVLGFRHSWLSTVHFGELVPRAASPAVPKEALTSTSVEGPLGEAFRTGQPVRIDDLAERDDLESPFETARSLCTVPVGDIGVIRITADRPNAFDDTDVALLEGLCNAAAAVLQRNWDEMGVVNERNRLEREVGRLERERDRLTAATEQLVDERDRIAAERDQLLGLVEDIAKPTLRYEITDGRAVVRDVNEAVEAVFGDDPASVVGDPVGKYVVPEGLEERAETLATALRANEQYQLLDQRETVEGMRDFMLTIIPLERAADAPSTEGEGLLVYDDITESKQRELELAAASARLERIAELIDEEVDEPLSAARSYLELAEKTGEDDHFAVIDGAHEQLYARLEEIEAVAAWDDATEETEPIAIQDIARRAWIEIDTGDATLVTEDDLILEADREALRELFEYVLRTAVDEDENGDGDGDAAVTITVGATDDGFYVAGDRPTASEPGTEADGRQEAPTPGRLTASDGAGLKLGIVERIAEQHGWDVGVAEDEDGTAFAFRGVDAISVNRNRV